MEYYKCHTLNMLDVFRLFNTEEHKMNLERIFLYYGRHSRNIEFSIEDCLPFMSLCQRCGLFLIN